MRSIDKLNARQREFVRQYTLPDSEGFGNPMRAAILAGYSAKVTPNGTCGAAIHAQRLLARADVQAAIKDIETAREDKMEITAERVAGMLMNVYERAIELGQMGAAATASTQLGKLAGLFTERVEQTTTSYVVEAPAQSENAESWLTDIGRKSA